MTQRNIQATTESAPTLISQMNTNQSQGLARGVLTDGAAFKTYHLFFYLHFWRVPVDQARVDGPFYL